MKDSALVHAAFLAGRQELRDEALAALRTLHPACMEPSVLIGSPCSCAIGGIHLAIQAIEGIQP